MPRSILPAAMAFGFAFLWAAGNACAQAALIDLAAPRQTIDGFGASTAWHGPIGDAEADAAFGNGANQMGLSILRVRIDPMPMAWQAEKSNAQKAKSRGAAILASPWTPPPAMKTNNDMVGGELRPDQYPAYAAHLRSFCAALGTVDVVSLQSEPNIRVKYESCSWTGAQIRDFCKSQGDAVGAPLMMPEAFNFDPAMSDPALDDPDAARKVSYVGGHLYASRPFTYSKALDAGKKVWMTEFYVNDDEAGGVLQMGRQILDCMVSGMHAYVWWYLSLPYCNLVKRDGTLMRKGYAMAQFSKFIRPGYRRIEAAYQPQPGVFVAAFRGETTVIVAINQNTEAKVQPFAIANGTIPAPRKFVTSASKNLADEGLVGLTGDAFTAALDAQSITTFVATPSTRISPRPDGAGAGARRPDPAEAYLPTGRRVSVPRNGAPAWPVPLLPAP